MSVLGVYLRATPWFLPLVLGVAVLAAAWLSARRADRGLLRWCTAVAVAAFVGATVTPSGSWSPWGSSWNVSWTYHLPRPSELSVFNDSWVNIALAVPLGFFWAAWLDRRPVVAIATVTLLPVAVEIVQMTVPPLGRSGFLMQDVGDTWIGAALGFAAGLLTWRQGCSIVLHNATSRAPSSGRPS